MLQARLLRALSTVAFPQVRPEALQQTRLFSSLPDDPDKTVETDYDAVPADRVSTRLSFLRPHVAITLSFIKPTFAPGVPGSDMLQREGRLVLNFGAMDRAKNKLTFHKSAFIGLTATEVGLLLTDKKTHQFYHDSLKGTKEAGTKMKALRVETQEDGQVALGFSLSGKERHHVGLKVKPEEWEALKVMMQYGLPRLVGYNRVY